MNSIVFLCSGGGGNLRFVHHAMQRDLLPKARLCVIADRPCGALEYAMRAGIDNSVFDYGYACRQSMRAAVAELNPDLVITTIHKILDEEFVQSFRGRLINVHYSLLPAFSGLLGMKPVDMAIKAGCRWLGATTHEVIKEVDAGPILAQCAIARVETASNTKHYDAVFRCGALALHVVIAKAFGIRFQAMATLDISGWRHFLAPGDGIPHAYTESTFWESFKWVV